MVIEYRGRDKWGEFLRTVEEANEQDGTISPGGASRLLRVSRQRVYQIVQENQDVRAWAFFDPWSTRQAEVYEIAVRDLLQWAVRIGRMASVEDLGWRTPRTEQLLSEVLQADLHTARKAVV